jgi:hypothetical protein
MHKHTTTHQHIHQTQQHTNTPYMYTHTKTPTHTPNTHQPTHQTRGNGLEMVWKWFDNEAQRHRQPEQHFGLHLGHRILEYALSKMECPIYGNRVPVSTMVCIARKRQKSMRSSWISERELERDNTSVRHRARCIFCT